VIGSLRAEWTKLRTSPSTRWLLLGTALVTILVSTAVAMAADVTHCPTPATCQDDIPKLSLSGVRVAQVAVLVLAVLAITNEYGTRMITLTFAATPRRHVVLLSKVVTVVAVTAVAAGVGVLGAVGAARLILPGNGFTAALGYPELSLLDGPTLRAAAGSVVYLALIAMLGTAIGTIVRDTAAAILAMTVLLFLSPVFSMFITDPVWLRRVERFSPMSAGLAIQATRDVAALPITPWGGLGVLAAYAVTATAVGVLLLAARDT
jgi:hypothetical protein